MALLSPSVIAYEGIMGWTGVRWFDDLLSVLGFVGPEASGMLCEADLDRFLPPVNNLEKDLSSRVLDLPATLSNVAAGGETVLAILEIARLICVRRRLIHRH